LRNTTVEIPIQATGEIPFSHKLGRVRGAVSEKCKKKKSKKKSKKMAAHDVSYLGKSP